MTTRFNQHSPRSLLRPVLALAMLAAVPAWSADLYVARNVSGASDTNDGRSLAKPFKTVSKGVASARAGDTVYIHDGTYIEDYPSVGASGTEAAPIVITAGANQNPVITCREFAITGRSWVTVRGLTMRGAKALPSGWRDMPAVVVDDSSVTITPGESWSTREAKARRKYATFMTVLDTWSANETKGITISGSSNIVIRDNTVSHHTRGIYMIRDAKNVTIENNRVSYCQFGIQAWAGSGAISVSDATIAGNTCTQTFDHAILITGAPLRVEIRANHCTNAAVNHIGMNSGSRSCSVVKNVLEQGGFYSETMKAPGASAISVYRVSTGCKVDSNYASYHRDLTHYDGNGIIIDTCSNPVVVSNNVCYRNMGSGITQTLSPGCTIVNNTCSENGYNTTHAYNGVGIRFAKTSDINAKVVNNVLYRNRRGGIMAADLSRQTAINYNIYTPVDGTPLMRNGYSSGYTTLAAVRANTAYEDNGRVGEPRFIDGNAGNYRLLATSDAKDVGTSSYAPVNDSDGVRRSSPPDCGAYEVSSTVTTVFPLQVDFQPAQAPMVSGWIVDNGGTYARRGGQDYGWTTSVADGMRDRNLISDQLRDTLAHMKAASWEIAVPNGTYNVTVVCGDAGYFNSIYKVNAEGIAAVNAIPVTGSRFATGTVRVTVGDGRLTLSNARGAVNNKLCSVKIDRAN